MALMRGVDTGAVFKQQVQCFRCDDAFYFTLRKIAEAKTLTCPHCGSAIDLTDGAYGSLVTEAKEAIALIDDLHRISIHSGGLQPERQAQTI